MSTNVHGIKIKRILDADENFKKKLCKAVRDSLKFDKKIPPKPKSPRQIEDNHGVSIPMQLEFGIILTKNTAVELLNRIGLTELSKAKVNKDLNAQSYFRFYKRKVSRLGIKSLVFTIAEVQQMTSHGDEIRFPEELEGHF